MKLVKCSGCDAKFDPTKSDKCPECGAVYAARMPALRVVPQPTVDIEAVNRAYERRVQQAVSKPEVRYERKLDGVDWARKILARIDAGEHLPMVSERLAREALALVEAKRTREPGEDESDAPEIDGIDQKTAEEAF